MHIEKIKTPEIILDINNVIYCLIIKTLILVGPLTDCRAKSAHARWSFQAVKGYKVIYSLLDVK